MVNLLHLGREYWQEAKKTTGFSADIDSVQLLMWQQKITVTQVF